MSLTVMRGTALVTPIAVAALALDGSGLAIWLAGMTWRPPSGKPRLRRVRLIQDGDGTWDTARSAFLARWRASERAGATLPLRTASK